MSCDVAARIEVAKNPERLDSVPPRSIPLASPFVSVIIPVFNDAPRLRVCLEALSRQSWPRENYEIIVVDNGSSDGSGEVALSFSNVQVVREAKPGSYAARNRGIAAARGDFLAFTDSDCIPSSDWIRAGVAALEKNPERALIGGPVTIVPHDRARRNLAEFHQEILAFDQLRYINSFGFTITANMLTRRFLFDQVGVFHSEMKSNGDREWCHRAVDAGHPPHYEENFRIGHHARRSVSELAQKVLRLAGGKVQLAQLKEDSSLKNLVWSRLSGMWSTFRRIWRNEINRSLGLRIQLIGVEIFLTMLAVAETVRVWYGGKPRRR